VKALVRTIVVSALLVGTFSLGTRPAWACSCVPLNARQTLAETDGAFIGELVTREDPVPVGGVVGPGTSVFTFHVSRAFKGDVGEVIQVESESQGEACGLEVTQGDRIGLFLMRLENRWTSNLCLQVEPGVLAAAAKAVEGGDAAKAPGQATGEETDAARPASAARQQGSPVWPWVVIVAVAAAIGSITMLRLRARRSSSR